MPAGEAAGSLPRLSLLDSAVSPPVSEKVTRINCHRLGQLALVGIGTFAAIWLGGVVLALLWAPTSSPSRLVAYLGSMFAVTGAVLAVVIWAAKGKA